jgi:hypothetical protein
MLKALAGDGAPIAPALPAKDGIRSVMLVRIDRVFVATVLSMSYIVKEGRRKNNMSFGQKFGTNRPSIFWALNVE